MLGNRIDFKIFSRLLHMPEPRLITSSIYCRGVEDYVLFRAEKQEDGTYTVFRDYLLEDADKKVTIAGGLSLGQAREKMSAQEIFIQNQGYQAVVPSLDLLCGFQSLAQRPGQNASGGPGLPTRKPPDHSKH